MTSFRTFLLGLLHEISSSAVWLFSWLAISFAVFAWVARSVLYSDPAPAQFGNLAVGALGFVAAFGVVLIALDLAGVDSDA